MCSTKSAGKVKLLKAALDCYPNLAPAVGHALPCSTEDFGDGNKLFKVPAEELEKLGCNVGTCGQPFPFYGEEVEELNLL